MQPKVLTRDLEIDMEALREKDRRDRSKLKSMIELCYDDKACRQEQILRYFGETESTPCGSCDVCRAEGVQPPREGTTEEVTMLRQALSGIARMSTKHVDGTWEGRFGKGRIIQMLVGGKSKEIVDAGHDQLSTYGLLKHVGTQALHPLFAELEKLGLIETSSGEYPIVSLTAQGIAAMKGGQNVKMRWPSMHAPMTKPKGKTAMNEEIAARELGFDDALFEKLKRHRTALAESEGVPSYVIFNNQTLEFMTRLKPKTIEAGLKIRGVGEKKAKEYLPDFIQIIKKHSITVAIAVLFLWLPVCPLEAQTATKAELDATRMKAVENLVMKPSDMVPWDSDLVGREEVERERKRLREAETKRVHEIKSTEGLKPYLFAMLHRYHVEYKSPDVAQVLSAIALRDDLSETEISPIKNEIGAILKRPHDTYDSLHAFYLIGAVQVLGTRKSQENEDLALAILNHARDTTYPGLLDSPAAVLAKIGTVRSIESLESALAWSKKTAASTKDEVLRRVSVRIEDAINTIKKRVVLDGR
ncbi:MAG TPA: RQC domain-containing protein [Prosthecobacter sp.]|nr:RQC domain-containing protein [Prosthecobacter sp.]